MRSVPLLTLLGASFARGILLEPRDLESEDTSENLEDSWSDIVERHDNEFFAAQYPLTQTDNPLVGITSIDPNLDGEGINAVDEVINSIGTPIVENSPSEKDNQANRHTILKRVPDYYTRNRVVFRPGVKTHVRTFDKPVTVTRGPKTPVTVTKKVNGPVTVTVSVVVTKTATEALTITYREYGFTRIPTSVTTITDDFLTLTYRTLTVDSIINGFSFRDRYFTVTRPGTVTITKGVGPTVTITKTFTSLKTTFTYIIIPVSTRVVLPPNFID